TAGTDTSAQDDPRARQSVTHAQYCALPGSSTGNAEGDASHSEHHTVAAHDTAAAHAATTGTRHGLPSPSAGRIAAPSEDGTTAWATPGTENTTPAAREDIHVPWGSTLPTEIRTALARGYAHALRHGTAPAGDTATAPESWRVVASTEGRAAPPEDTCLWNRHRVWSRHRVLPSPRTAATGHGLYLAGGRITIPDTASPWDRHHAVPPPRTAATGHGLDPAGGAFGVGGGSVGVRGRNALCSPWRCVASVWDGATDAGQRASGCCVAVACARHVCSRVRGAFGRPARLQGGAVPRAWTGPAAAGRDAGRGGRRRRGRRRGGRGHRIAPGLAAVGRRCGD